MNEIEIHKEKSEMSNSSYNALKVLGGMLILFGPVLPLTILLWRLAVGG